MEALIRELSFLTADSFVVAGCTDFLAQRNGKTWHADVLISLSEMKCLREIRAEENVISVGAAC
ncbi:MAG: FAD binding domain-containing protein, partial [Eubacteriales bacterium]|nr:FAD binding domain-containing protein [Eubacteriales bacterium]